MLACVQLNEFLKQLYYYTCANVKFKLSYTVYTYATACMVFFLSVLHF